MDHELSDESSPLVMVMVTGARVCPILILSRAQDSGPLAVVGCLHSRAALGLTA